MDVLSGVFITVPCPKCGYGFDVELSSVRLQRTVFCPCCKSAIKLVDQDASIHGSQKDVNSSLSDLERQLKRLEGVFKIGL